MRQTAPIGRLDGKIDAGRDGIAPRCQGVVGAVLQSAVEARPSRIRAAIRICCTGARAERIES